MVASQEQKVESSQEPAPYLPGELPLTRNRPPCFLPESAPRGMQSLPSVGMLPYDIGKQELALTVPQNCAKLAARFTFA